MGRASRIKRERRAARTAEVEVICPGMLEVLSVGKGDIKLTIDSNDPKNVNDARTVIEEMLRKPIGLRFLAKVEVDPETGCWPWTGSVRPNGYGQFNAGGGRIVKAHRWAYQQCRGPIPAGFDLDHQCHNRDTSCAGGPSCRHRRCINPWHLEPATRRENLAAGRPHLPPFALANAAKSRCKNGHQLLGTNLIIRRNGHRQCRACALERTRAWRDRKKAGL